MQRCTSQLGGNIRHAPPHHPRPTPGPERGRAVPTAPAEGSAGRGSRGPGGLLPGGCRCKDAPRHLPPPGRAGCSAGRGRGARGGRPAAPLTWQKHRCAAVSGGVSGGRGSSWPERSSSHAALRRPIRKPQRRSMAGPADRRPAPWGSSPGAGRASADEAAPPAPPAPRLPAPPRPLAPRPLSGRHLPGACGRARPPAPPPPGPPAGFLLRAGQAAEPLPGPARLQSPDVASGEAGPAARRALRAHLPGPRRIVRNSKFLSLAAPPSTPPAVCQSCEGW